MIELGQSAPVGPVAMSLGQLLLMIAAAITLFVAWVLGRKRDVLIGDVLFNAFLVGFVAARVVFVIRYFPQYDSFLSVLDIRDRGFDALGGVAAGALFLSWRLYLSPAHRLPVGGGIVAGVAVWAALAGGIWLLDETSRPMPESPLMTLDGEPTTLPQLQQTSGKPMVVNLWATWCPPCRREMPVLEQAQQTRDDIDFVFANQREQESLIRQFIEDEALTLDHVVLDLPGDLAAQTGSMGLPTTLYYNADGRLVDVHFGELSSATLQRGIDRIEEQ